MSTPIVPPRPQRSSAQGGGQTSLSPDDATPSIPPRPVRKTDPSPHREVRSPLNLPPTTASTRPLTKRTSQELPGRPPSVSLPNLGQEGEEYSSFDLLPPEAKIAAAKLAPGSEQTRNVAADLPMHQPKASVAPSTATKSVQKVTETDNVQKLPPADASPSRLSRVTSNTGARRAPSIEPPNSLRARASFNRSNSAFQPMERATSRTGSAHGDEDEHGIPAIGQQVPLLWMAGDVQAPTPGGGQAPHAPGIGFFNDGSSRSHHRKRSSRHEFGPPDSYGIRHDADSADQFEKEWIKKHPEAAAKEGWYAHLHRPETALTSDQLNRLVHESDSGIAAAPGTPGEEEVIDFALSRMSTPQGKTTERTKRASSGSAPPDSPARAAFAAAHRLHPSDAIAVEESPKRSSRSFYEYDPEHEHPDGAPILAADEIVKRPGSAYMHAAVVPEPHAEDEYYDSDSHVRDSRRNSAQPTSRPSSVHGGFGGYSGGPLHRFVSREEEHHSGSGTPLEEIEEYEPLFPEDGEAKKQALKKAALKRRPDLGAMHHFPSQDIWEDTPSSLQYSTTVTTPDLERARESIEAEHTRATASTFETPEQEQARRSENDANMTSDKKTFMKPHFKPGVLEEVHRPAAHRFPSSDVWEDTPSSMMNTTTVGIPEMDDSRSAPEDRATTSVLQDDEARATTGYTQRPSVPSRPERKSKLAQEVQPGDKDGSETSPTKTKPPSIPGPKPSIPARPQRPAKTDPAEDALLEQSRSAGSEDSVRSPPVVKSKPAVPARPGGAKIAALQAGFMSDLNNRLRLGPQGPPKKEAEPESSEEAQKAPLEDARKSRARGPPRRKPASSPAADRKSSISFAMSPLVTMWSIDEEDELKVQTEDKENKDPVSREEAEKAFEENEVHNTEAAAPADAGSIAESIAKSPDPAETAARHRSESDALKAALAQVGAGPAVDDIEGGGENVLLPEPAIGKTQGSESNAAAGADKQTQTSEVKIKTELPSGDQQETTVLQGANAHSGSDVIVEHDGSAE